VEYAGHLIDSEGMHFTQTKLDSIARFEEPKTMFKVKHFLGLANYFRDHVPNFSVLAIPLLHNYFIILVLSSDACVLGSKREYCGVLMCDMVCTQRQHGVMLVFSIYVC
jgi:hypothetical protein